MTLISACYTNDAGSIPRGIGVCEGGPETPFPYPIPGVVKLREEAPTGYTAYIYYNIYSRVGVGHDHDTPNPKSVRAS